MGSLSDFTLIPALDIKDGAVVHAKAGPRAEYRPISSPFGAADDPVAIARGLLGVTGSSILYIADLDAIAGAGANFELLRGLSDALHGTTLWIDAGFSKVADCAFWFPLGATLVIGSESLATADIWREMQDAFGETVVLSLDFDEKGRRGPEALFADASLWPSRAIVMNVGRVGTEGGPDLDRLRSIVAVAGKPAIFAAGGVRHAADLAAIIGAGARGALIATALHSGALTQKEIAALLRGRRS
jgi:HisA/HisF family protein